VVAALAVTVALTARLREAARRGDPAAPAGSAVAQGQRRAVNLSEPFVRRPVATVLLTIGIALAGIAAFFALPVANFSTTTGQPTNAVYGFTSMLINVLRDEAPTHVAVAFDISRQTFRMAEYSEYKAGRSATPDEFKGQISLLHEVLDALRHPICPGRGLRGR